MPEKYVESFDGTKIYYILHQRGSVWLLFLHGWPHNHTVWNKEIRFLSKHGYSTIAVDLRGHGKSDKPKNLRDYALKNFAHDINIIIRKEKISKIIIIGHSLGGMIALNYYSLFPKTVKALVLLDTIYENPLKHVSLLKHFKVTPLIKHLLQFILAHRHLARKHFPEINFSKFKDHTDFYYWIKGTKVTPFHSIVACLEQMLEFNKNEVLSRIKVPTLILEGEKDTKTSVRDVQGMAKKIKGSKLVIVPKATHDTNLRNPGIVEQEILKFLGKNNED